MRKASLAAMWHSAVFERDAFRCAAAQHDPRCWFRAEEAHHIVYRSHLTEPALWLLANGIALSKVCHMMAHRTHNLIIGEHRLIAAVDAVNSAQPAKEFQRPYFTSKGIAMPARG